MKKLLFSYLLMGMATISFAESDYHIGILSGTVSQSEDALRGAEAVMKKYGKIDKGGKIIHLTYPDNFMQEMETTITQITSLADDPKMKAIIMTEAIPGTVEAFRRVRDKRPDILLLANNPHEDPEMVADVSDLTLFPDSIARGYLIVKTAKDMGAKNFVHVSFPRHLSYEMMSRRRNIMKQAAKDLGMGFYEVSAPDPVSDVGVAGAQQYILEQVPNWLKQYGKETAFFCTNDAHTEPLLKRVAEEGGYFVEADLPSPTMGYPGALGIKFSNDERGNWPKILAKVEKAVIGKGAGGRMGTWSYSYNFAGAQALADHAVKVIEEKEELLDFDAVMENLKNNTPGAGWNGSYFIDSDGVERENYILVYQDTYVFGKGYMGVTKLEVPEKYFDVK
ncbi:DUF3798 domain-containing protein [Fusobacterium sp.]|uniref:DUF3798 domain-containing protein n=3 Tax=Fusobacterium sp. TaxID=68766 RepID=UPI0026334F47|nr:DUF3798 domain-containing protein [Fusobacterium sp.]